MEPLGTCYARVDQRGMDLVFSYMPVDASQSYSEPVAMRFGFDFLRQLIRSEPKLNCGMFLREDLIYAIFEMIGVSRASQSQWRYVVMTKERTEADAVQSLLTQTAVGDTLLSACLRMSERSALHCTAFCCQTKN